MIEFLCIHKKTGKPYRRLFSPHEIKGVVEEPDTKEVILLLIGTERRLFRSVPRYAIVSEDFETVRERLNKKTSI